MDLGFRATVSPLPPHSVACLSSVQSLQARGVHAGGMYVDCGYVQSSGVQLLV